MEPPEAPYEAQDSGAERPRTKRVVRIDQRRSRGAANVCPRRLSPSPSRADEVGLLGTRRPLESTRDRGPSLRRPVARRLVQKGARHGLPDGSIGLGRFNHGWRSAPPLCLTWADDVPVGVRHLTWRQRDSGPLRRPIHQPARQPAVQPMLPDQIGATVAIDITDGANGPIRAGA